MSATAALIPGWTKQSPPATLYNLNAFSGGVTESSTAGTSVVTSTGTWWPTDNHDWWYVPYHTYPSVPNRVCLTSKEVDRLRAAAKRDAKLKAVLEKFTSVIEVEVEF